MNLQSLSQISIPVPCHENWDAMTEAEKGRFCAVCQKTVIDFSQMNETEIIHTLNEKLKTESVCGRFHKNQVSVTTSWTQKISQKMRYFALALLMAFGVPKVSKAQLHEKPITKEHLIGEMMVIQTGSISGTLKDKKTNIIISQAEVQVWKKDKYLTSVKSNHNGFYKLENLEAGEYTLKVFRAGYNVYEIQGIKVLEQTHIMSDILLEKLPKSPKNNNDHHIVGMIAVPDTQKP